MNFIILAGGRGTRLAPVVNDVPKPMAPINGKPFLEILLAYLAKFRPERFILCVSHMASKITSHFGTRFADIPIAYSLEEEPLGTGGAIRQAFQLYGSEKALVINGDTFAEADYSQFLCDCAGRDFGILLTYAEDAGRYGKAIIEAGQLAGFCEKEANAGPGLINAGAYILNGDMLVGYPEKFSFEKDFLEPRIKKLKPAYSITSGQFIDIGTPESYEQAAKMTLPVN